MGADDAPGVGKRLFISVFASARQADAAEAATVSTFKAEKGYFPSAGYELVNQDSENC